MSDSVMTVLEASKWASNLTGRTVTPSNISYLIQYGRVSKINERNGICVSKKELENYYNTHLISQKDVWKEKFGNDLNWTLSFAEYKESETTKHVHRLHPYKGKFIPQLVEYFLDDHIDEFKKEVFFHKGDIILDPFCGSGTTLVQANELGMYAVGIDISVFNSFISNAKIDKYNLVEIMRIADKVTDVLHNFQKMHNNINFEKQLLEELRVFNNKYFPVPEYRRNLVTKQIDESTYSKEKEKIFLDIYYKLTKDFKIDIEDNKTDSFLDKWFMPSVKKEIDKILEEILNIQDLHIRTILQIILSRTVRSCRATTHADLATLIEPIKTTYYCKKHGKICKPIFSLAGWWKRYVKDTVKRLHQFEAFKTNTRQVCLTGDSKNIDIIKALSAVDNNLFNLAKKDGIAGIFSSPPYVGLIDYHEQHAYAYDLLQLQRKDEYEIGPLYKGQGIEARKSYVEGIVAVLNNSKQYLRTNYNVFLVANDKYGLYPTIAEQAGMKIVNQHQRPVLNRTEKDKQAFTESIFHLKAR